MTAVAEAIALALSRWGVTHIFGQSLPSALMLAAEDAGIRQVVYRTENAGGAMADGFAKISNRIGVVAAQNGPAATLLVPPLTEAMLTSTPILALVQDVPTPTVDRNAFQELDHRELFEVCSKWTRRITDPARAVEYVDRAITIALSGRPGPVVLLLPKDVLISSVDSGRPSGVPIGGSYPLDRPRAEARLVEKAAELLARAERPLVVAGGGVNRAGAAEVLARIQEFASVPVATTNMGKGAVDERHPLSVGVIGNVMGDRAPARFLREWVNDADLVLLVGTRTNENGTDAWSVFGDQTRFVHLDVDGTEIGRNYPALRLVGDARSTLEDLAERLASSDLRNRQSRRRAAEAAITSAREAHARELATLDLDAVPIRPERVMREIDQCIDEDTVLVADASYSTIWLAQYITSRRPGQQFVYPRGMAGLGWGLPMALGAKVAAGDRHVVAIVGDGGFAHVWSELETAIRMDIHVTVVLLNNSILGFQKHSELVQFSRHTSAITFDPVDHVSVARACGAAGVRVERPEDLAEALRQARRSAVPTLIEVMADPDAFPPISSWERRREVLPGQRFDAAV